MEGSEMEMTEKELQRWIRRKVRKNPMVVAAVERSNLLRSLLKRRENQANNLQKLCRSVAACEGLVKRQYSLLGWEYQDTCSDNENGTKKSDYPSTCETPDHDDLLSTNRPTPSLQSHHYVHNGKTLHIDPNRRPVVVLTPLSPRLIRSLGSPAARSPKIEDEQRYNFSSDPLWEPDSEKDSDSDFSITDYDTRHNKRQKIREKNTKHKSFSRHRVSQMSEKSSTSTCTNFDKTTTNRLAESKPPANKDAQYPVVIPELDIHINIAVLAWNGINGWQKGKIIQIVTNEQGIQMYKVCFEDGENCLVSGHHLAFGNSAQLNQLCVGSCVVVERTDQVPPFRSGILVELPTYTNKQRFLVFFDDHTPVYLSLSSIYPVCKPLKNPLDDISDKMHKNFIKDYLEVWPYPPRMQYSVGEKINATLDGVLHSCEVVVIDSSLIQVIFKDNQHKDWIYRGSPRLEHIVMRNKMPQKADD